MSKKCIWAFEADFGDGDGWELVEYCDTKSDAKEFMSRQWGTDKKRLVKYVRAGSEGEKHGG